MHYTGVYQSPLGEMYLASDDMGLCGVWFQGQGTGLFAHISPHRDCLSDGRLGGASENPLWADYDLWGHSQGNSPKKRDTPHVRPGCGWGCGPQPCVRHHPLSQGCGDKRQPDRLRWRHWHQGQTAHPGKVRHNKVFCSSQGNDTLGGLHGVA